MAQPQMVPIREPDGQPAPAVIRLSPAPVVSTRVLRVPAATLTVETVLYGLLLLAGFAVRIWDVGSRAMHGDEAVHAWLAWNLFSGVGYQYDPVYHGPLQFIVTAAFFFLFGDSTTTARLMAVLFGTALIALPLFLRPYLGRLGALITSALIALSPAFIYVSRLERDDIFTCFFALTMAIALFGFLRTHRPSFLYLGAASIALSLSAMENTYISLFIFGSFVLLVLAGQVLTRFDSGRLTAVSNPLPYPALAAFLAALVVALSITVATGLGFPVPLVLAVGAVLLVARQAARKEERESDMLGALRAASRREWVNALTILLAILLLTFSTVGSNLRGIWDSTQPILNLHNSCPGNNYILNPCRKDIIGGLFYWLSQHQVHRGGQPWFYYILLMPLYEQIAVLFGVAGMIYFLRRPTLFTTFVTYWAVLAFGIYSWAGEKFPWLLIHPLLPFTILAGMFVAEMLAAPGIRRSVVAVAAAVLVVLEMHTGWELNFVNGADPVEMMVYVQSSPDTPRVASNIETISYKATGGTGLHVTVDALDTWPFAWYLRHMPNVAYPGGSLLTQKPYVSNPVILLDDLDLPAVGPRLHGYTVHRYRLRWWFPEDYKQLTWSSAAAKIVDPGTWKVIWDWLIARRPFGPKGADWFYYYVKNGLVSPF